MQFSYLRVLVASHDDAGRVLLLRGVPLDVEDVVLGVDPVAHPVEGDSASLAAREDLEKNRFKYVFRKA